MLDYRSHRASTRITTILRRIHEPTNQRHGSHRHRVNLLNRMLTNGQGHSTLTSRQHNGLQHGRNGDDQDYERTKHIVNYRIVIATSIQIARIGR